MEHWITTSEAAARLGVKRGTLYSYVSRGVLTSKRMPGQAESLFDRTQIDSLAAAKRDGRRSGDRHDERDEVTPSGVGEPSTEGALAWSRGAGPGEGGRRGHRWISSRALVLEKLTTAMIATMRKMMIENADANP